MARPSKLSSKQWAEVEKRLLAGEIPATLAKEFGIDRAAITRRFSQPLRNIKSVAKQIVETDAALKALPVAQQVQAINLADEIKQMTMNISSAGTDTALVSKMFAKAAKDATNQVMFKAMGDDGETISPERLTSCTEEIAAIMKSTMVSNEASKISLKLMDISAKKDDKPQESDQKTLLKQIAERLPN